MHGWCVGGGGGRGEGLVCDWNVKYLRTVGWFHLPRFRSIIGIVTGPVVRGVAWGGERQESCSSSRHMLIVVYASDGVLLCPASGDPMVTIPLRVIEFISGSSLALMHVIVAWLACSLCVCVPLL